MGRLLVAFASAALLALAQPAAAQSFRTYLASYGNDANAGCTLQSPCRLLPAAIQAVATGGEIWILDSANFNQGTVTIAKPVSILVVPGKIGSIVAVAGQPAISITSNVTVGLRNVVIAGNASNPGTHGIVVSSGAAANLLSVEDSLFVNLQGHAIYVHDTASRVSVKNSVFRNNTGYGVLATNGPTVEVTDCRLFGNQTGGVAATSSNVATPSVVNLTDSTVANGGSSPAVTASVTSGGIAKAMVVRTTINDTGSALVATGTGALVAVVDSSVSNNDKGFNVSSGGVVKSLGNNYIGDNRTADVGALVTTATR